MPSEYETLNGYDTGNQIIVHTIELPFEQRRYEYEWRGEGNTVWLNSWFAKRDIPEKPGTQFWLGHLHLLVVDYQFFSASTLCALMDGRAYQMLYARRLRYFLDNLYARLILTLYVWGLAHIPRENGWYERPSWRHIGRRK